MDPGTSSYLTTDASPESIGPRGRSSHTELSSGNNISHVLTALIGLDIPGA